MIISRSIHVATNGNISFFLWLSNIPLYTCTTSLSFLLPSLSYCTGRRYECWGACIFSPSLLINIITLRRLSLYHLLIAVVSTEESAIIHRYFVCDLLSLCFADSLLFVFNGCIRKLSRCGSFL